MPEHFKHHLIIVLTILTLALPLRYWMLGRRKRSLRRSISRGAIGFMFAVVCAAWITFGLVTMGTLELEWRGGYVPVITRHKTHTNLAALESSRSQQTKLPATNELTTSQINANWSGFRGPNDDAQYTERPIITNWPATGLKQLWHQACGGGYSSFAMAGSRAYTLEQRRDNEVLVAYDIATGRELWTNGWPAKFLEYHSDEGPRTTPAYSDGKVYALGATGEFRCVDATNGAVIWAKNISRDLGGELPDYGISASPLVVDEKIILQPDAYHSNSVVCYNKNDGKILWHALDMRMGYATPMLVTLGGERQIIVCGRPNIVGLRLEDGAERWSYLWHINDNERPITQPVMTGSNTFMVSAAYMTGAAVFQVDYTNGAFSTSEVWKNKSLKTKFASAVYYQGYIYGLDEDILVCVDAQTGERKWKDGRYGYGQLLLASGYLIVVCADGRLALVKATPDAWTEVAAFSAWKGKTWNVPAIGAGRLLIRNNADMACYEISPP